ncbi:MAG: vWA domain-containing protein [Acetobacteraceae bacterium]
MSLASPLQPAGRRLAANVLQFARLLRRAGLPVGTAEVIAAAEALTLIDLGSRREVATALAATMVRRQEHRALFDSAFALFWRDPAATCQEAMLSLLAAEKLKPGRPPPGSRRLQEAFSPPRTERQRERDPPPATEAVLTASERERLQQLDFEAMSAAEIAAAKAEIRRLVLPLDLRRTRRRRADPSGPEIDLAGTLRLSLRQGGEILRFARRRRISRPPPLVVICDISGSMARYTQLLLHFVHALTNLREHVQVFLFGTRLSNVTRQLRYRDPEVAFQLVAHIVPDWSGGTRIGEALASFNRFWARRVLAEGAIVLLVSDGLDRAGARGLAENMDRLHRSCRYLIWLNPLLRWDGFAPRSQGIRAMLPYVDEFRPVHNLQSLRALVSLLSRPVARGRGVDLWRKAA